MKKLKMFLAVLVVALAMTASGYPLFAAQTSDIPEETNESYYSVTISFDANGGKGTMNPVTVKSNETAQLPTNAFSRSGYQFNGWNTAKNGTGTAYANQADVKNLVADKYDGYKVTLYAQWKLTAPKIKKVKSKTPTYITVSFDKLKSGYGYEIQYSTKKNFSAKKTATVTVTDKTVTSKKLYRVVPNTKYFVRMRTYVKKTSEKSPWSAVKTIKVKKGKTIMNVKGDTVIETDIKLTGSGTGYHAKLVMGNPTSAVSFGLQYDQYAEAPYTGKTMALIENISSNDAGGQTYTRPGNKSLRLNKTYHLMMVADGKGNVDVYLDYKKIGSCYQAGLKELHFVRIEACPRLNGDRVDAQFSNIQYKIAKKSPVRVLGEDLTWEKIKKNAGLSYKYDKKTGVIRLFGTGTGINGDWDSDYEGVSYILQFGY